MISRLSSITRPSGNSSTGTVPFGETAIISDGLLRKTTSRNAHVWPLVEIAMRARIA